MAKQRHRKPLGQTVRSTVDRRDRGAADPVPVALQQGPSAVAERINYRANIDALKRAE